MGSSRQPFVTVQPLEGRKLFGVARQHAVITDRPAQEGGGDLGCTSGELLLLAIGSCVTGALRNFLEQKGIQAKGLKVEVGFEASAVADARDRIAIALDPGETLLGDTTDEALRCAATSGRVASRVKNGSEVVVRIIRPASSG